MDLHEAEQTIERRFRSGSLDLVLSPASTGYPVGSAYVDLFWTPAVGAGAMTFARWAQLRASTEHWTEFQVPEVCEALGRLHPGRACAVVVRAVRFHLADVLDSGVIQVRTALPEISDDRWEQLTPSLRALHGTYEAAAR